MYVYFLKTHATWHTGSVYQYKIGHASDVAKRMSQLQTGCPMEIQLFGTLACKNKRQAASVERQLHEFFKDRRQLGEWFRFGVRQAWALRLLIRDWPVKQPIAEYMPIAMTLASRMKDTLLSNGLPSWTGLSASDSLNRAELIDKVVLLAGGSQPH
jgi:hypothetical protein